MCFAKPSQTMYMCNISNNGPPSLAHRAMPDLPVMAPFLYSSSPFLALHLSFVHPRATLNIVPPLTGSVMYTCSAKISRLGDAPSWREAAPCSAYMNLQRRNYLLRCSAQDRFLRRLARGLAPACRPNARSCGVTEPTACRRNRYH